MIDIRFIVLALEQNEKLKVKFILEGSYVNYIFLSLFHQIVTDKKEKFWDMSG